MCHRELYKYCELKDELKQRISQNLDMFSEISDQNLQKEIDDEIIRVSRNIRIPFETKVKLSRDIYNSLRKLDVLQELIEDDNITEIMVNSYDTIFIEKNGKIKRWEGSFESEDKYADVIQQIVSKVNRVVNDTNPIVDARLDNGSRVCVVLSPIALDGSTLTIRKFPDRKIGVQQLIEYGTLTKEVADFLQMIVTAKYNIILSGGTSSGKTTMLNALADFIPQNERIITIEDLAELRIDNIPNIVRLEAKNANMEGNKSITIRDLIKASLRMRPDRIILGEVRDEAAIDLLSAYNTGHDGSLSTAHSNSARDMLQRLETMVLMGASIPVDAIKRQIAAAVDIIIHVSRMRDNTRRIVEITEVAGMSDNEIILNPLFVFEGETGKKGELRWTGNHIVNKEKLIREGGEIRHEKYINRS